MFLLSLVGHLSSALKIVLISMISFPFRSRGAAMFLRMMISSIPLKFYHFENFVMDWLMPNPSKWWSWFSISWIHSLQKQKNKLVQLNFYCSLICCYFELISAALSWVIARSSEERWWLCNLTDRFIGEPDHVVDPCPRNCTHGWSQEIDPETIVVAVHYGWT